MKLVNAGASAAVIALLVGACGGGGEPSPARTEYVGQSCAEPAECYPGIDAGALRGDVECLARVPGGYCTHLCETDADCCAVPGECKTGFKQVCAPFESTGKMMCFLSCERGDLHPAADGSELDDTQYCRAYASPEFGCRSTGGGSKNRKVCVP